MTLLAAVASAPPATTLDKLKQIPTEFWVKVGLGIAIVVVAIIVLRKVAKVNKVVLAVGVFIGITIIGFNWIYERDEPAWATPAVRWMSGFFPSKGKVESKH
jgi:hypothetical protein